MKPRALSYTAISLGIILLTSNCLWAGKIINPALHEVLKLADVISPGTPGRYRSPEQVIEHGNKHWQPDIARCREYSLDYLPVVFPGFSWHNLKPESALNLIPRLKGEFLWSQFVAAKHAGAGMIYVAMFDEVDEGTAIFKCTNERLSAPTRS